MQSEGPDPNPAQPARFQRLTMVPLQPVLSACLFQLCILCLKGKMPSLFVFFSSHWPICSRKTYFLAKSLSFTVSALMPEKYQQSKRQSIFKPKTPSWLKASSSARCPSLPPCFPGTA